METYNEGTFNINDSCRVKLTKHAKHVLVEFYKEHGQCPSPEELDGKFRIWELMSIFGKHTYNGARQLFDENKISIYEAWDLPSAKGKLEPELICNYLVSYDSPHTPDSEVFYFKDEPTGQWLETLRQNKNADVVILSKRHSNGQIEVLKIIQR